MRIFLPVICSPAFCLTDFQLDDMGATVFFLFGLADIFFNDITH